MFQQFDEVVDLRKNSGLCIVCERPTENKDAERNFLCSRECGEEKNKIGGPQFVDLPDVPEDIAF